MRALRQRSYKNSNPLTEHASSFSNNGKDHNGKGCHVFRIKGRSTFFNYMAFSLLAVMAVILLNVHSSLNSPWRSEQSFFVSKMQRLEDSSNYQQEAKESITATLKNEDLKRNSRIASVPHSTSAEAATYASEEKGDADQSLDKAHNNDLETKSTTTQQRNPFLLHYSWTQPSLDASWNRCHVDEIHYYTDDDIDHFVKKHRFSYYPIFKKKLSKIEKIDYFRYLVIYIRGGFWVDVDVNCIAPVDTWLSKFGYDDDYSTSITSLDFVFGLEFPNEQKQYHTPLPFQLTQYTFGGRSNSQMLLRILEYVENITKTGVVFQENSVLQRTGPAAFTKAIVDEIVKNGIPPGSVSNTSGYPLALLPMGSLNANGKIVTLSNADNTSYKGIILPYRAFSFHAFHNSGSQPELTKHQFWGTWREAQKGTKSKDQKKQKAKKRKVSF